MAVSRVDKRLSKEPRMAIMESVMAWLFPKLSRMNCARATTESISPVVALILAAAPFASLLLVKLPSFFSRQLRFFTSQFLCLPLPRNNRIHCKSIPTPENKQVLLTKSLTTSQTRPTTTFLNCLLLSCSALFLPLLLNHP
jgi:hypothetical protein